MKLIGTFLQMLRKDAGHNASDVAEHLGYTRQMVSRWENSHALPALDIVVRWARYLGQKSSLWTADKCTNIAIALWEWEDAFGDGE